jgi:ABC-type multidrug transport system fused ATPase/permease subunit
VCFLGATADRRVSAGDLVTVGVSDIQLIGEMMDVEARGVGGVVSFAVVAALMLLVSWPAGLLVLAGVPVILLITTRISNVQRSWQKQVRDRQSELTDEAVDIVHGLRVLRGIGGERLFAGRYRDGSQRLRATVLRQARVTALLGAANTFLPSLLLTGVVALAAQLTLARQLSAGQLVAFYGYAVFMSSPIYRMTSAVSFALQAHVAAAKRSPAAAHRTRHRARPRSGRNAVGRWRAGRPRAGRPRFRPGGVRAETHRRGVRRGRRGRAGRPARALRRVQKHVPRAAAG